MDTENTEHQEAQKNPEEDTNSEAVVEETTENPGELTPEEIADLKKKAEASSQNFERLKKLEEEKKKLEAQLAEKGSGSSSEAPELSSKDVLFLAKADIHEEDVDDVLEWAKFKGIPVSEAYTQMKPTLDVRNEQRKTEQTTQVQGGRRGAPKDKGEDLLRKAESTGEVPTDVAGMKALAEARVARRRQQK